jgi:hypothetical protein
VIYRRVTIWLLLAALFAVSGCLPKIEAPLAQRLVSEDPQTRVGAAVDLADEPQGEADGQLVRLLADQDEAVRFYASAALKRRTGQRFDYQSQGTLLERAAAVRKWIAWCEKTYPETEGQFSGLEKRLDVIERCADDETCD